LVRHLARCGFVVMRQPAGSDLSVLQQGAWKPKP
jgi:hypothetical protein